MARAEGSPASEVRPREQPARWYGWQTLAADGGAVFLFVSGFAFGSGGGGGDTGVATGAVLLSVGTYLFIPPIIHAVHRNGGTALGSFAMRFAAPFVGGFLGAAVMSGCQDSEADDLCHLEGAGWGVLAGFAAAMTIDAALLSYESSERSPVAAGTRWAPAVGFTRDSAWVGIGGAL